MNERVKFIAAYLEDEENFTDLCSMFCISRKTGYKWVTRYQQGGVEELSDHSRKPHHHPNSVTPETIERILQVRRKHPRWGPKKLLVILRRQNPHLILPVASAIGNILKRHGLVKARKRRRISSPYQERLGDYAKPNAIWCADFKGHFPVGGERCYPLTISDGFSRLLLRCEGMRRPLHEPVQKAFTAAFRQFGMPDAIRTDNGAPFSILAPGGLSRLAVWWIKLGIRPERIAPGRPDQNGRHERMHSTLKAETARPPRNSFRAQQRAFDLFTEEYNTVRPHEALDQQVPASLYKHSLRAFPEKLSPIEYPAHFRVEKAYPNGVISLGQTQWYISGCLNNEYIGLEEIDDDTWKVYFGSIVLGVIDGQCSQVRQNRHFGKMIRTDGDISTSKRRPYKR